ncbi:MAG: peptidoglycan-binding domain-containing protein, partial [Pseudomonadota bacterium]
DPEERALWDSAVTLDTAGAYEAYLRRYPNGIFAGEARARLATLPDDATRAAEAAEEALGLSRNARREIQRALSLLGFDTGGVDGIFGPATRRAISNWQVAQRIEATGFLTDISMDLLLQQFNDRRAEFEAQDRAFWNSVGSRGDEAGLRAYLDRFPQGIFAGEAQRRLDDLDVGRDLDAWAVARATATRAAYESYLQNFPDGRFASEARAAIAALDGATQGPGPAEIAAAAAEEERILPTRQARLAMEFALFQSRINPGAIDGRFDEQTRTAIRQFQQASGLPVTGFVTLDMITRLPAGVGR